MPASNLKSAINVKLPSRRVLITLILLGLCILAGLGVRYALWVQKSNEAIDLIQNGQFPNAKTKALEALKLMSFLPDSKSYALNLRMVASMYACRRVFDKALIWDEHLLDFDRKTWGEKSAQYAGDLSDVALIRKKQKNYPLAEKLYQQVVGIFSRCPGKEADAARNKALLAWVLMQQIKDEEALELIADSDDFLKTQFGEHSYERLIGLIERAWLSRRENRITRKKGSALSYRYQIFDLPEEKMREDLNLAYEICTQPKDLERSSAQTVVVLNLLAQIFRDFGENEKALKIFEIAEQNCRTSTFGGFYNSFMADILKPHAELLQRMEQNDKAELLLLQAKQVKEAKNPE